MHKIWVGFIIIVCYTSTLSADQRRALEGFQGMGESNAEAVTNAKAQCFQWAADFSEKHFVLGTPDCGSCVCTISPEHKCQCFGSIRFDDSFACETPIRHRTVYSAAEGAAYSCGEAKFDAAAQLYEWQRAQSENRFITQFTKPECYCHSNETTQSNASCRASITFLECTPKT